MTLALLLTAVGGAWAQSTFGVKEITADMLPASWSTDESAVTADDLAKFGFMEVTKDAAKTWTGAPQEGTVRLIYTLCESVNWVNGQGGFVSSYKTHKDIYDCLDGHKIFITTEITEWDLTSKDGKNWILDKMPASNIELQVEYFAESNLFLSKDALADKANIAVKAGDLGVQFGDDGKSANTVTEGTPMTVKFNGTKKLLGLKVEKKAPTLLSIQIDGHVTATIYYFEGETWEQAIQNHPTENSAWKIQNGNISGNGANLFAGDEYEKVNPNDTIDPKAKYHLMWT